MNIKNKRKKTRKSNRTNGVLLKIEATVTNKARKGNCSIEQEKGKQTETVQRGGKKRRKTAL